MGEPSTHHAEHQITVLAPAEVVYDLVSDVERWPLVFPPTIHAERLARTDATERIRLWATANGQVKTWTSQRVLDRERLRVEFHQEITQPPVDTMVGRWEITPLARRRTRVVLSHEYRAVDDDPAGTRWIERAVNDNSKQELSRLRNALELARELPELTLTFADSVRIDGRREGVYGFLNEAQHWPKRLPHVNRLGLVEEHPGIQQMEMDTRAADGSTHTTRSVRVCFPVDRIVYKQTEVPALMAAHLGEWTLAEDHGGVLATSRHTVVIRREAIRTVLGASGTISKAREFVQQALSTNSLTTLRAAGEFVAVSDG